ncbi:hypothetical protein HF086_009601, partial [Spodoptera exigua]
IERTIDNNVSFFDLSHVAETIAVAFRPRTKNKKLKILLTLLMVFLLFGPTSSKVNSLFSLTETTAALVFHPLYSWMYMKTLHALPGAVFLASAAIAVPPSIILLLFYIQNKIGLKNLRKIALEAEEKKDAKEADIKKADPLAFIPSKIEKEKIEAGKNV